MNNKWKRIIITAISTIIFLGVGAVVLHNTVFAIKLVEVVTIEAGSDAPNVSVFFEKEQPNAEYITDISSIELNKPGQYDITLGIDGKEYISKLEIKDTTPPEAETVSFEVWPEEVKKPEDFVQNIVDLTEVKVYFETEPDYTKVGEQEVKIVLEDTSGNKTVKTTTLTLKADTEAPVITGVEDQTIFVGDNITYDNGVTVSDNRDDSVELEIDSSQVNLEKAGQYEVVYRATDDAGNMTTVSATITVNADTEPPVITGVKNQSVIIGGTVSYKRGIEVTDNYDTDVQLNIDSSKVNLKKLGSYEVVYSAQDKAGNTTKKTATITVVPKPEVKIEEVNEIADQVLAKIVKPGMSTMDKAWAIYKWGTSSITYTGSSDKSDWKAGALVGFKKGTGDCFNYYATSRALLNRIGVETKTVTRINGKTQHYWLLVNIDGGWYHFDTTPHYRSAPFTGFLRTDAELDDYSANKAKGYYTFDKSKYPSTPENPHPARSNYFN